MSKGYGPDDVLELLDKAYEIIRNGLESTDEYTRNKMAIDFTGNVTLSEYMQRKQKSEEWHDTVEDDSNAERGKEKGEQNGTD